ncbi:MAG: UDP-N-acetylmuramoyl-L-alanyl-D-glutamate--2,6-diaminopimelate ligase [Deltaproteobacteria bacterium]|nr:UDP-N-acetylmuramoyl-L-alanyl-D-glutamate--2,6-diaminopimelate ligase [Deltaproteobacteria bacterium]
MTLGALLQQVGLSDRATGPTGGTIDRVVVDSREVTDRSLFIAMRGLFADGHEYIHQAIEGGARAIIAERPAPASLDQGVAWVEVEDSGPVLGRVAAALYDHPSRDLKVLAVTGTNGKTTVSWLLDAVLTSRGYLTGVVGTIETRFGDTVVQTGYTTPPAHVLHGLLARMRDAGVTHVLLEASSHGLKLNRMSGVEVAVGGYTNLSRDHMDFHPDMEDYRNTKASLFRDFGCSGAFNIDDEVGASMAREFSPSGVTVSTHDSAADLWLEDLICDLDGCHATLHSGGETHPFHVPLIGRHNAENGLVAIGMLTLAGMELREALLGLSEAPATPGRLERVPGVRRVLVDYAHSPDALENVLGALRPLVSGRIICVFGAGGDRDPGKRPEMGAIVDQMADYAVVTSDNPRSEDPQSILDAIVTGMSDQTPRQVVVDRREAIELAARLAGPEDLVLLAGKGHETTQEIAGVKHTFDDRLEARRVLDALSSEGVS